MATSKIPNYCSWKLHAQVTGATQISWPTDYNDLQVHISNGPYIQAVFSFNRNLVNAVSDNRIYEQKLLGQKSISLIINNNVCLLDSVIDDSGADVKSSTTVKVYYR